MGNKCMKAVVEEVEHELEIQQALDLAKIDPDSISDIPGKGEIIEAYVYDVYDGDTCSIIYAVEGVRLKTKLRLIGIDTPEKKPSGDLTEELIEAEKAAAEKCKVFLTEKVGGKVIKVKLMKYGKYAGRTLGHVYDSDGNDISEMMIELGYAKEYNGAKKEPWTLEQLNNIK